MNLHLESKGVKIQTGTIVDVSVIHAPSSTKNEKKQRDPAMQQTRKGNQWFFGFKTHIGVDSKEGHVHSWRRLRRAAGFDMVTETQLAVEGTAIRVGIAEVISMLDEDGE